MTIENRDVRHVSITSEKLRSIIHEAWKNGNDSCNIHSEKAGRDERYAYVDSVMAEKGYKRKREEA